MIKIKQVFRFPNFNLSDIIDVGEPIFDKSGFLRIRGILKRLLQAAGITNKTILVGIGNSEEDNAATHTDNDTIVISKGALDQESDVGLAETLGHELSHRILMTGDQFKADELGATLALKAGFDPDEMLEQIKHIRAWVDDDGEKRYQAMAKVIRTFKKVSAKHLIR